MSQDNLKVMHKLYKAFGRGDIPAVLGQMHETITWTEADGDSYIGSQAVLEGFFASLGGNWEGFTVTPEEFLDAGDHIITLGTYAGSNKKTGQSLRLSFAHVWGLAEGR